MRQRKAEAGMEMNQLNRLQRAAPVTHSRLVKFIAFVAVLVWAHLEASAVTPEQLADAQSMLEVWRVNCNHRRLHSSLGNLTPSEFAGQRQAQQTAEAAVRSR